MKRLKTTINLAFHWRTVWQHRRFLLKTTAAGLFLGLLVALVLPKEYEAKTLTAAESIAVPNDEGLDGLSPGRAFEGPARYEALKPSLYPDIFLSTAFLTTLLDLPVQTADCPPDSVLSLREYLQERQRRLFPLSSYKLIDELRERIAILPDRKTRTMVLACRMQNPLVAATVLDSLNSRIRRHITEYRTRKEREELAHAKKLQEEARQAYFSAQEAQAAFEDRNRDLHTRNAQKELVQLRVKTNFAREEYARATLRVKAAETQVVRVRPVFAVIEPPTAPVRPASPSRLKYMAGFALLGFLAGYAHLWLRERKRQPLCR